MIAPRRAGRPGAERPVVEAPTQAELDTCPFCAGREHMTPPETLRLPTDGEWRVRVVPNLYPAFARQEVVVHTPRHARSVAELDEAELALVARTWQLRRSAEPHGYLHALLNEGRAAGASLAHTHSQLVWLREPPPALGAERDLSGLLDGEPVLGHDGVVALCPPASRSPYELVIAPEVPEAGAFESELLPAALSLLGEALRRLRAVEGAVPVNAWLHDSAHWHIEVVPRLTVLAGVELGAGIYVNPLAPEEAAARLRAATSS